MSLSAIEALLHDSIGLHSSTVGSNTIRQAVNTRMRACQIQSLGDYLNIVDNSATELHALIEAVVIPETWFFRDKNPFSAFSRWLIRHKKEFTPNSPLRILSLPCSSGEEPYTVAMCLADCGVDISHARLDAIDISSRNLNTARQAEYGNNSFRGNDLSYRSRHFESLGNRYRLKDAIRERVNFHCGNLMDQTFVAGLGLYHVIFCRNLLIYFDRPTQHLAIDRISNLLMPNGLIFVGHSETSLFANRPFAALEHPRCFGFRQGGTAKDPASKLEQPTARKPGTGERFARTSKVTFDNPFNSPESRAQEQASGSAADKENPLHAAFDLANAGHLDEAALICESLLKQPEHQSDAHYLLGLVREAAGNCTEAERLFKKAVYLDPGHFEALTHLSVIADRSGNKKQAQRFKDRALRARETTNTRLINQ